MIMRSLDPCGNPRTCHKLQTRSHLEELEEGRLQAQFSVPSKIKGPYDFPQEEVLKIEALRFSAEGLEYVIMPRFVWDPKSYT